MVSKKFGKNYKEFQKRLYRLKNFFKTVKNGRKNFHAEKTVFLNKCRIFAE